MSVVPHLSLRKLDQIITLKSAIIKIRLKEMETNFHLAYAHNKSFIERVKERNAYAYSVATFMDDIELNSQEKQERQRNKQKLQDAYFTLVEGIKNKYLSFIVQECENRKYDLIKKMGA